VSPLRRPAAAVALACAAALPAAGQELAGRAVLPADTRAPGPPSGRRLGTEPIHGVRVPFASQPVLGISSLVATGDGSYLALPDNGYGPPERSADFYLRVYTLRPDWATGAVAVEGYVALADPDRRLPFPIVEEWSDARLLTGADLDVESLVRAPDGTLWVGDELGPFLLHFDAGGRLLEPPAVAPDPAGGGPLLAPDAPLYEEATAVRVLNALARRGARRGASAPPVLSPAHVLLADGDPATAVPSRARPREGSGLAAASSELFDVDRLHAAGYAVVPYTVNDPERMAELLALGVDGIISDDPERLYAAVAAHDADGDGAPGDLLDADGLIAGFDAQGHRGARDLRPENTLPAFEAALDHLMTTLETDAGVTADGVPVLCHEPDLDPKHFRRLDGAPAGPEPPLIRERTAAALQATWVADRLVPGRPRQRNDRDLSPVAVAFAAAEGLADPYTIPTLDQVLRFPAFYADHYAAGPGAAHPDAERRALNARRVRWNVETKLNPRRDRDGRGRIRAERTAGPEAFVRALVGVIAERGVGHRVDLQSFDLRTLLAAQDQLPALRAVWLVGDYPIGSGYGDGTNLQDEGGRPSPWLAGLRWPYRRTREGVPPRVPRSGGFEGLALAPGGERLVVLVQKPLLGAAAPELLALEYDRVWGRFTGRSWRYPLGAAEHVIGSFELTGPRSGLVIERDGSQGELDGFKAVFAVDLGEPGGLVAKRRLLDLLAIPDPRGVTRPVEGDVGLGDPFALPFRAIESLAVVGPRRLVIANDDDYPFGVGRRVGADRPDDTELVLIELAEPLSRD